MMRSLSTRALGQPSETKPTFGAFVFAAGDLTARRAFAVVQVGDPRPYGCFLLRKGVIAGGPG